ncbi:jg6201 [Pararge aegeria aegeria]|uniref:Jg6201 protein n=1 Tax=Pararge aegeria aegeria TaxID=348720 RepID=A0A8S4S7E1_9NEOP|nr:jg6201 [Pararge aegeria aegeria]
MLAALPLWMAKLITTHIKYNLVKAEKEKVSKYLDLAHEITAMWNVESIVIVPIVVSVNGLFAKSFDKKAVVLETARIVRSFLTLELLPPVAWALKSPEGGCFFFF